MSEAGQVVEAMTQEDNDQFMNAPEAQAAVEYLHGEMNRVLVRLGHGPMKSLVVIAHLEAGAYIHADGCLCRGCKSQMIEALGRSFEARAALVAVSVDAAEEPKVH